MNAGETNDFARVIIMFDARGHIQRACGHATRRRAASRGSAILRRLVACFSL